MPRISVNEMTTYRWSFDEDISHFDEIGIGGVGVWRRKLSDYGEERGIEMLRESRLNVSSLSCAGGFTGSDGQSFREAVEDALEALHLAAELQAGTLVVVTGARGGHTRNHARRLAVEALRVLGDAGEALGVEVAVRPAPRSAFGEWTFLKSLDETMDLISACDNRHVGLVCDLAAWPDDMLLSPRFSEMVSRIKIAALSDIRPLKGSRGEGKNGPLPAEALRQLEEAGYQGWYELQILCEECWMSDYPRLIADCFHGLRSSCPQLFADRGPASSQSFAASECGEPRAALQFTDGPVPPA